MFFMVYPIFVFKGFYETFTNLYYYLEFYIVLLVHVLGKVAYLIVTICKLLQNLL